MRAIRQFGAALLLAAAGLVLVVLLLGRGGERALARQEPGAGFAAPGDPLLRIQCTGGYTAAVYAEGLSSPDGLALSADGVLHVVEETAGRVSQVGPGGIVTPLLDGLSSPEGITFDDAGNLYVVEDVAGGRLIRRTAAGLTSTLAAGLDAPEDVVWAAGDALYVSESNVQFVADPRDLSSRVAAVSPAGGAVTGIVTSTPTFVGGTEIRFWSYAGLALGPDGRLYVSNELSGVPITHSVEVLPGVTVTFTLYTEDGIFQVDPATGDWDLFAAGLVAPEGLSFAAHGGFPLYVAEEDVSGGGGRLSRVAPDGSHTPLCTGFMDVEDVVVDARGWLYVSEDGSGTIVLVRPGAYRAWLPLVMRGD